MNGSDRDGTSYYRLAATLLRKVFCWQRPLMLVISETDRLWIWQTSHSLVFENQPVHHVYHKGEVRKYVFCKMCELTL